MSRLFFILAATFFLAEALRADEKIRPRNLEEQKIAEYQNHHRVHSARVAYVNYQAVRRDFVELRDMSNAEIDGWILENFAYLSERQQALRNVRTSHYEGPTLAEETRTFGHPATYDRAAVAPAQHKGKVVGLVDLKGSGSRNVDKVEKQTRDYEKAMGESDRRQKMLDALRISDHRDGMMSLGEAIAEVTRQQAVQKVFDLHNQEHGTGFETVENYFVIDLGVELLKEGNSSIPAAILGRQAHWRGDNQLTIPAKSYSDNHGVRQGTIFETAVDFGGVFLRHPELFSTFGVPPEQRRENAQESNAWKYGHETADFFKRISAYDRAAGRRAVESHVASMLAPLASQEDRRSAERKQAAYLFQALQSRDPGTRAKVVPMIMALPPKEIEQHTRLLFANEKFPITGLLPVLQALLEDPRFKDNELFRQRLIRQSIKYKARVQESEKVSLEGLKQLSGRKDARALVMLLAATAHLEHKVRENAVEQLKTFDTRMLTSSLDRIFASPYPTSVIGPLVQHLLRPDGLPEGAEREALIQRSLSYTNPRENPSDVLIAGLNQIRHRTDADSLKTILKLMHVPYEETRLGATEALLQRPYADIVSQLGYLKEGPGDAAQVKLLQGYLDHAQTNVKSTQIRKLLYDLILTGRVYSELSEAALSAAKRHGFKDTNVFAQAAFGEGSDKFRSEALSVLLERPIAERLALANARLTAGESRAGLHALLLNLLGPNGLPETSPERFALADRLLKGKGEWSAYTTPVALAILSASPQGIPWDQHFAAISSASDEVRRTAVAEFIKRDVDFVWSKLDAVLELDYPITVRRTVIEDLLDRLPPGSDRYYELLEKALSFSTRSSDEVLGPLLAKVASDSHPLAFQFVLNCSLHENDGLRTQAVPLLLRRPAANLLPHLARILASERYRSVIEPVLRRLLGPEGLDPLSSEYAEALAQFKTYEGRNKHDINNLAKEFAAEREKRYGPLLPGPCPVLKKIVP